MRDEGPFLGYAAQILHGGYVQPDAAVRPMRFLWHGPGFPALLTPAVALGLPLTAIRFVEPLLLSAAALAFHRLLRLRLEPRPALVFTYAFGIYAPFLAMLPELRKDLLAVLLMTLGMLALTRALAGGGRSTVIAAGLAFGALVLTRVEYGWVLLVLTAAAVVGAFLGPSARTPRRALAVALVAVAVCVPWLAYTHSVTGRTLYWGNSGGLSLFWMSPTVPGETGEWHPRRHVLHDPVLRAERPLFNRLPELSPLEQDSELQRVALANVRAHPWLYARNLVANATRLLFLVPMRYGFPWWAVAGAALFNGLLLAALARASVRLWRERGALPPETVPFALIAALGFAIHLPASAHPRLLLALVPLILWFVAHGHRRAAGGSLLGARRHGPRRELVPSS